MDNILDYDLIELQNFMRTLGEAKFRASQVFSWLYKAHKKDNFIEQVTSFDEMTNIPAGLRERLKTDFEIYIPRALVHQISELDSTEKFLLEMSDGNAVESVFMEYKYGNSLCISTQAGCRMGCKFCASTVNGLERDLTAGEMVGQILAVERNTGKTINHVVLMGTGEPFDNYNEVSKFIRIINHKKGFNLGMRNITISTCGILPVLRRFGDDFLQVNLAISLHSADNEIRSGIMPINNKYNVDDIIQECKEYVKKTGRRVTFEYTLVKGVNDSKEVADILISKIRGLNCHVNLITLNDVRENSLFPTNEADALLFQKWLVSAGIQTTIRRKLGQDIDGACGQLRLMKK